MTRNSRLRQEYASHLTPAGTTLTIELPVEWIESIASTAARMARDADDACAGSPYLTVGEAAEYMRCGRQRIYDLLSAGRLTRRKDGARVLLRRDEIDRYLVSEDRCPRVAPCSANPHE